MRQGTVLAAVCAAFMCWNASAQVINRCVGKGGAVGFYSGPCPAGYQQSRSWDATPEAPPTNDELWKRYYQRKQGEADSRYLSQLAGTSRASEAAGHQVRATNARNDAQCEIAKMHRADALERAGLNRSYDFLSRLDEMVRDACR